jgi:hypothetical protein
MALTSAQIVDQACQIAKSTASAKAGQLLNSILNQLALTYDFDLLRAATTLSVSAASASYSLPADYLRQREVFYNVLGTIFYLNQIPLSDYDQAFLGPGINNYPEWFATDMSASPPLMYFWPPPNQSLSVIVKYSRLPADITTPETSTSVPWFPVSLYLITRLAAELMAPTDDARRQNFLKEAASILDKYLMMDDDQTGFSRQVTKDARQFRNTSGLKPTKQTGF